MDKLALVNGEVFDGNRFIGCKDVLIEGCRIEGMGGQINSDCRRINVKGMYVCPGFIDIHIHGALGFDFTGIHSDGINKICDFLAAHGVTSILATAMIAKDEKIRLFLQTIKEYKEKRRTGANILGVHLEGPFINEKRKGALDERFIRRPSVERYINLVSGYEDIIKTITLAPEVQGSKELMEYLRVKGVGISIGHSDATYDEIKEAVNCGASRATHIFNAMNPLNHREPGTVGGILDCEEVSVEIIADLIHLHPAIIRLILHAKGKDKCIMISDSVEAAGLGDGEYEIGGNKVIVKDGIARQKESHCLCGSTITLDQSVRNLTAIGIELGDALQMVTSNPAKAIGLSGRKGEIKSGSDADITVLDKNLDVVLTIINGELIKGEKRI